jgi:hypothetical protein
MIAKKKRATQSRESENLTAIYQATQKALPDIDKGIDALWEACEASRELASELAANLSTISAAHAKELAELKAEKKEAVDLLQRQIYELKSTLIKAKGQLEGVER